MSAQARDGLFSVGMIVAVLGWIVAGVWWASRIEAQVTFVHQDVRDLKGDVRLLLDGQRADRSRALVDRDSGHR